MKKVIISLMIALFLCTCVFTVAAQENGIYESAGELYEAWMRQNGVPDYISGVWSTDGGSVNLTFGLVSSEEGMAAGNSVIGAKRCYRDDRISKIFQKLPVPNPKGD